VGLGLTIIFGLLQYLKIDIPTWLTVTGIGVGVFTIGIAAGLAWQGRQTRSERPAAEGAVLRLHVYGDSRSPMRLDYRNIFRWYFLKSILIGIDAHGVRHEHEIATLFVTFERDVLVTTLAVNSPDIALPSYEVKEFNQRFAIIAFSDKLGSGTLEIAVTR
jgi:hypothetical protein